MRRTLPTLAILAALLVLSPPRASAQPAQPRITPPAYATLPGACAIGDLVVKTGSGAGLYVCTAANTWAAVAGGGGSLPLLNVTGSGVAASLTTDLGVMNADLTWTNASAGQQGDAVQIAYVAGMALSADYVAPVLTITFIDGVTTAQDIIDLGSYDSAPVTVATAPGNDGSGVVIALSATNLTGGLGALNVTGPTSLDGGEIVTDGSGNLTVAGMLSHGTITAAGGLSAPSVTLIVDGDTDNGLILTYGAGTATPSIVAASDAHTDVSLNVAVQGAGTINLNSNVVLGTQTGAGAAFACFDAGGALYRSDTACVP